jgi:hypothetical protein
MPAEELEERVVCSSRLPAFTMLQIYYLLPAVSKWAHLLEGLVVLHTIMQWTYIYLDYIAASVSLVVHREATRLE